MTYQKRSPRARIGFIIPSSNRMVEPQMQRYMPAGVTPHFTRIGMTNRHKAPLDRLLPRILEAAELLADSSCDAIALQCTGTSMSGGVDMERTVLAQMRKATGRPALSAASSVTAALAALEARRIVFISETKQDQHDKKTHFLREAGFEIVADRAVGLAGTDEYCVTPPELWIDTALELRNSRADAYFISCANISAIDAIASLEPQLGRPVVTSNQAALWCALRTIGLQDEIPALGQLLSKDIKKAASAA